MAPATEGVGGYMDVVYRGAHDDWNGWVVRADLFEQAEAVGAGHHDVGQDEVVVGVLLELGEGLVGAGCDGYGVAAAFQKGFDDGAYRLFVIDDQDSFLRHRGGTLAQVALPLKL